MRNAKVAFPVVALVLLFSVSATGQQSDTGSPSPDTKVIVQLPAEPVQPLVELTLADAARQNNFPLFEALYTKGGNERARFSELYSFWKWSMTDRIGAFYGEDVHAKFAGEYPDYSGYIADYDILDSNGHTFYPSAETRAFLLKHAIEGTAPIAPKRHEATAVAKAAKKPAVGEEVAPMVSSGAAAVPTAVDAREPRRSTQPAAKAVAKPAPIAAPTAAEALSTQPTAKAAVKPAPIIASSGAAAVPATVDARGTRPSTQPPRIPLPASDHRVARGFALIIAGLVVIGVIMLMLRTPREEEPAEPSKQASIEPLRIIPLEPDQTKKTA